DYLVIATGPELAFDEIEGFGPSKNSSSICHVDHASEMAKKWERFCADPAWRGGRYEGTARVDIARQGYPVDYQCPRREGRNGQGGGQRDERGRRRAEGS